MFYPCLEPSDVRNLKWQFYLTTKAITKNRSGVNSALICQIFLLQQIPDVHETITLKMVLAFITTSKGIVECRGQDELGTTK